MIDKTKPISIRLAKGEIDQLQARAYSLSGNVTGVARDLIRTGLAGGDNKALADRLIVTGMSPGMSPSPGHRANEPPSCLASSMASCMASAIAHLPKNSSCQAVSQLIRAMPRWGAHAAYVASKGD
jgi:hypothetical protein